MLDKAKLTDNIEQMNAKAAAHGVRLRPHLKTAKCAAIASMFNNDNKQQPITVSTLREAEYFADAGFVDILYAVSIEPGKFARLSKLYQRGVVVTVILDALPVAQALCEYALEHQVTLSVMIEIDVDGHRAGVKPDAESLLQLANLLESAANIQFAGLMTHGGGSYDCQSIEEVRTHADLEQAGILRAAKRCREAGMNITTVSIGSTPTVVAARGFNDIDEIRPGVFVFFDLFQMQLGICALEQIALSVLCSVITHKTEENCIIVDAGGLALSKDRSTQGTSQDYHYGLVADLSGKPIAPPVNVTDVNQEHGIIHLPAELSCEHFPIGQRLRIFPNHACMTAAAYEGYVVLDTKQDAALEYWGRCNGW
ncbi:MAG: alanine racemase [Aestuariibacter sp.]